MHEKKEKSYGGIEVKYRYELETVRFESLNLALTVSTVAEEMRRDDSPDMGM